jgi:glycine/D-amino acid oxidase-like deaminating enzyme/nitrite reductase/ring-hydroxylating ferredoxin subunit
VIKISGNKDEFKDVPNPYWIISSPETNFPALKEDINVDVAIVGGGIVGITSAYLLVKEGLKVAIIEADHILHGTTGHTTAKITSQHSLIYARLIKEKGEELARQYADANETAIHTIADLIEKNNIDCDFMWRPAYIYTQSDNYLQDIEDEAKAASSLGIKASLLKEVPLPFAVKSALRFDGQAQFHPLKYLHALVPEILKKGSLIFEQTRAISIEKEKDHLVITNTGKRVRASKVIVASHFPFFDGGGLYFSRIYNERSYVLGATIKDKFPEGMFISAENPTRSLRSQRFEDGELILIGGEHHKTGHCENTNLHYSNLIDYAKSTFQVQDMPYRWSTQDCMTTDGVPYVGNLTSQSPNVYVATGFGKWGMTNSTAAAMIIKDLITKGDSPWASVYNPSRFSHVKEFLVQNLDVAKSYISGKLEQTSENRGVGKGEAKIINVDGKKAGAYRDENDKLYLLDITCTHVGCELEWNSAERSWDCPCHGSRFNYQGDIIEGPALNSLKQIEEGPNKVEPNIYQ